MVKHRLATDDYSHVSTITDYMLRVIGHVEAGGDGLRILDLPAGNGFVVAELRRRGHDVVGADINRERDDYVIADMEQPLPFEDGGFDAALCLEGIEHVVDENLLLRELLRIIKPGGTLVISTPNVMNLYSRWFNLFRGYLYQFPPGSCRHVKPEEQIDRGHVNPLSYIRLRYLLEVYGADVISLDGDRIKKKVLLPLLLPISFLGRLISRNDFRHRGNDVAWQKSIRCDLFSRALLFSRSLIIVAQKRTEV